VKLPFLEHVRVDREKITDYLLSPFHPDGAGKAIFFTSFGFRIEDWHVLARALRKPAQSHTVSSIVDSDYGSRYAIEGTLETPDGRRPIIRTIWILERDSTEPRLITAYPVQERP
jgi:hypothetical protein